MMHKNTLDRLAFILIALSTLISLTAIAVCLYLDIILVSQGLLYIPIILACAFFARKGFLFSVILSVAYFLLTIVFSSEPANILAALGRVIIFIIAAFVVTYIAEERQKTVNALLQFRTAVEQSVDGIAMSDMESNLLFVNEAWSSLHGYSVKEMQERNLCEFPTSKRLDHLQNESLALLENRFFYGEIEHTHKNGTKIPTLMSSTILRGTNQEPNGILWIMRDITELKQADIKLRDIENRVVALTEAAQDAIVMIDPQGKINFWNPAAERIFGYQENEVFGKNLHKILAPEKYQQKHFSAFEKFQRNGEGAAIGETLELTGLHKNGHEILIELSLSAIKQMNGWTAIGIMRDITQRKQAEKELKEAKDAAEAANRAKSEFLANMSHEIRTPMNAVLGLSKLLLMDQNLDKDQRATLLKINNSSNLLLSIINDILDYSKIEAGRLELDPHPFSLDEILDYLRSVFINTISEKGLDFFFDVSTDIPGTLYGDSLRLSQVISNLLSNAVKFTEKGFIKLCVKQVSRDDHICTLRFEVIDSGIGITTDQSNKLFKAFTQADSSTTRKFGGTGLGLVISNKLVNLMQGSLEFDSVPGEGSRFFFEIPFEIVSEQTELDKDRLRKFSSTKALIVDDQKIARSSLRKILESWKISVVEAASGAEAVQSVIQSEKEKSPFNFIFMDWKMPGNLDGIDAIHEIRRIIDREGILSDEPLIFVVSAYQRQGLDETKDGFNAFLNKPVTASLLFDTLIRSIGLKGSEAAYASEKLLIPDFSPFTLLVADDNQLNQLVAVKWLEKTGASINVANDGVEAVRMSEENDYDLILMDIQMPVMDGLEAAMLIHSKKPAVPIIALSAAVMESDIQNSFEAGMIGHINKPIDEKELYQTLSKCLHVDRNYTTEEKQALKKQESQLPELDGFDLEQALRNLDYDEDLYEELLLEFKKQLDTDFKDIISLIKSDHQNAPILIHTLKGVSGTLGAMELYDICIQIDKAFKTKQPVTSSMLKKLEGSLHTVLSSLYTIDDADKTQIQDLDENKINPLIQKMSASLEQSEIIDEDTLSEVCEYYANQYGDLFAQKLRDSIHTFDYKSALDLLEQGNNEPE